MGRKKEVAGKYFGGKGRFELRGESYRKHQKASGCWKGTPERKKKGLLFQGFDDPGKNGKRRDGSVGGARQKEMVLFKKRDPFEGRGGSNEVVGGNSRPPARRREKEAYIKVTK